MSPCPCQTCTDRPATYSEPGAVAATIAEARATFSDAASREAARMGTDTDKGLSGAPWPRSVALSVRQALNHTVGMSR